VSFDGTTGIWQKVVQGITLSFEPITTLEGHENEVKSVAWNDNGALVATCGRDKSVWIWEAADDGEFECVTVLHGHTQDVKVPFAQLKHVIALWLIQCFELY
jgi:cytosolic iron-sulfur protein assembly protein CIAO1